MGDRFGLVVLPILCTVPKAETKNWFVPTEMLSGHVAGIAVNFLPNGPLNERLPKSIVPSELPISQGVIELLILLKENSSVTQGHQAKTDSPNSKINTKSKSKIFFT